VSRWLIGGMALACAIFFFTVIRAIIRMRRMPAFTGTQGMLGAKAIARGDLDPDGFVFVRGERWKAVSVDGSIASGDHVEVTGVRGFTLTVRRLP
jgi:membrane-bound serine protease (ClpP class)